MQAVELSIVPPIPSLLFVSSSLANHHLLPFLFQPDKIKESAMTPLLNRKCRYLSPGESVQTIDYRVDLLIDDLDRVNPIRVLGLNSHTVLTR